MAGTIFLYNAMLAQKVDQDEELHWLALRLVPGLGARKSKQLLDEFGTPQAIFRAPRSELEASGISGSIAQSIASGCSFEEAVLQQQKTVESGTEVIPIRDPRYPPRLREIFDPPVLLFAKGKVELLQTPALAMVGTRRPTPYGMAVAERLAGDLGRASLTIVSGMARGIDTASHKGVLGCGGKTIAVFGCGLDIIYPAENRRLADEIAQKGLLVSEYPMGTPGHPQNFPVRNRIIAGMSIGVLVVEGAQYSGSSITAKLAMEQGREVFAVPGNVTSKLSWGPNLLIKQGAKLVQDWNDVIVELPPAERRRLTEAASDRLLGEEVTQDPGQTSVLQGPAGQIGREILGFLHVDSATQVDDLLESLERYSSTETIAALFELEMAGLVRQLPGKNFVKVW
jgi:DNA processing protein